MKVPKKKNYKNIPANLEKQDYDEYELDDVEGDKYCVLPSSLIPTLHMLMVFLPHALILLRF